MKIVHRLFALAAAMTLAVPAVSVAQTDAEEEIEEVTVTGTRSKPRSATDSPVAIDSFNQLQLDQQPVGDLTENLKNLVPSFTATPFTGDGSSFIRSTSLRGLPPDEVLLLVNSKRRHRSALIHLFGAAMNAGAHHADMAHIPSIALKRVEVLRDGAASQYGSDAIAGVINFILRDDDEGGALEAQYGEFFKGESAVKVAGNIGFPLGDDGFLNISGEWSDYEQLIRGIETREGINVRADNVPNVGLDSPYGDTTVQTWGRPENRGFRSVWNLGFNLANGAEIYAFGNYADTFGRYRFFYREAAAPTAGQAWHDSLRPIPIDPTDPSQGNFCWCDSFPGGYTPYLDGEQTDLANVVGLRGEFTNGMLYDISLNYGTNEINYTLNQTLSATWGPLSLTTHSPGDLKETDTNFNADFSYPMRDNINLAFGFEAREEKYEMLGGSEQSWALGPWAEVGLLDDPNTGEPYDAPPAGSNGMAGIDPVNSGSFTRSNWAVYGDVEWDISDAFLLQVALRFEDFDDFGQTTNGKVAARYAINDRFTLRGAISTGFRAPTPGQSNLQSIVTTFDTSKNGQVNEGTLRPTDPLVVPLGGKPLEPEEAVNVSAGFSADIGESFTLTGDLYFIEVTDRIAKTFNIDVENDPAFAGSGFDSLAFYTNALDTETKGVDLVATWNIDWSGGSNMSINFAYNYNKTEVTKSNTISDGRFIVSEGQKFNIENNLPENRFSMAINQYFERVSFTVRANWYDDAWDERGFPNSELIASAATVDIEGRFTVNDTFSFVVGASNVFDEFPNTVETRRADGLLYSRRTPFGYDGGAWFVRAIANF